MSVTKYFNKKVRRTGISWKAEIRRNAKRGRRKEEDGASKEAAPLQRNLSRNPLL